MIPYLQGHVADPLQDVQKQRLLQPDSPRTSDSPRSSGQFRPQQLPPLSNYSPRQMPMQQQPQLQQEQLQQQLPQQVDQSDDWQWQHQQSSPSQPQAFEVSSQPPGPIQSVQNGSPNGQQSKARPHSASFADVPVPDSQPQTQSASQLSQTSPQSRPQTATSSASPPVTEEQAFVNLRAKNVSWQVQLPYLLQRSFIFQFFPGSSR